MKRLLLLCTALLMVSAYALADITCRGTVIDDLGDPVVGAIVTAEGQKGGVPTDIDGNFTINVPDKTKKLRIEFIGMKPLTVDAVPEVGRVQMEVAANVLQDVVVTQSIARTRKTPVAVSSVDAQTIDVKLGNQEFPEVLKTTPGVWATKDGGGYGDAKINMRGFKSANLGVMVNGVPVNDMEWGGIYWSNWAGLSDVTSSMQTQRGLGSSIISVPSVGGTINVITRSLDSKKGGTAYYGMGNDGLNQYGFSVSTGLMKNGWSVTLLGSHKWGDGYVQGTPFSSYTYFVNVAKRINADHQISFTAFGAPQVHDQRNSANGLTVEGWQNVRNYMASESPYRYNPVYGYDNNGRVRTSNHNVYHKPQISLNHIWQIDYKSSLSSVVYASIANGYGYSGQGRGTYKGTSLSNSSWYGANNGVLSTLFRRPDGTFDYGAIQDMNIASTTGSNMVMARSNNNHQWYGLVSTYKNEILPEKLNITGGIDVRYYIGEHSTTIVDLYDGEYFMDDSSRKSVKVENNSAAADPNWKYQKLGVGDVVYRDYDGHTYQGGVYAQGEYTALDGKLTAVLAGSVNNTGYWRVDRFYYDAEHAKSKTVNFWAGSIKGGVNYNIDRNNNVYLNGGYLTRAPYFSGGAFLQSTTSNATNPNAVNEKVGAVEAGYEYHSPKFTAQVNAYYTLWMDQTRTRSGEITSGDHAGDRYYLNLTGVDSRHMGVELNFTYRPARWIDIEGMFSWGDWENSSNATGYFYNQLGQPLANLRGDVASGILAPDHAKTTLIQKGIKVGGSAQTTGALGVNFRPFKGWRIGADWTFNARNYSDYQVSSSSYTANSEIKVAKPWRIPWGNQFDMSASYRFKIGTIDATLYGNVYNLFNYNYVVDAWTGTDAPGTWSNAYRVFYSFGRTYAVRMKVTF